MSATAAPAQHPLRFLLNGELIVVKDPGATRSLLPFLREDQHLTGTKEGCAEGDCGACTVVVGEQNGQKLKLSTVNACIQLLPTLDGKAVFTVEGLKRTDSVLHPVQQAMVDCHGAQCGFCTPGFIMSMWQLYEQHSASGTRPTDEQIKSQLTGNLCRCTGYRPIIEACQRMFDLPQVSFDTASVARKLEALVRQEALTFRSETELLHSPYNLEQLLTLREAKPAATLLAGGTDVGLWVTKQLRELGEIIYLGRVKELQHIQEHDDSLSIGAGVSLNQAYQRIAGWYPQITEMWERFASMSIRNAGTIGGNLANGSPIGDSMPWLIAIGATVKLLSVSGSREIPLEDFYLAYMRKDMHPDEILASVQIPRPREGQHFRTYKLSKRFDSDISAVCAAYSIDVKDNQVTAARIAFGGMAATPKRASRTEASLMDHAWTETTVRKAMDALAQDFSPLSDMRASADYRLLGARNLLYRFYLETRQQEPLPPALTRVFAKI